MNITIPADLASLLRDKRNKSAYIADALRDKLNAEEKAKRAAALGEAYRKASEEEKKDMKDWDSLSGEGL